MSKLAELKTWRDGPNIRKECREICGWAADEIERLRQTLEWLLENDELTNYGQKTAREALGKTDTSGK